MEDADLNDLAAEFVARIETFSPTTTTVAEATTVMKLVDYCERALAQAGLAPAHGADR